MTIYRNINYSLKLIPATFLLVCLGLLFLKSGMAQDIHFSQYYSAPLYTNPANTGVLNGKLRFANDFRKQWSKLGMPINTFYSSFDTKLTLFNQNFGVGGFIVHDQATVYYLTTDEFKISLSYSKFIHNHQFIVGIQPGYSFKSVYLEELTFGSQFNDVSHIFDRDIPNLEEGLSGNAGYFDMNIGIGWRALVHNLMPSAGFSISHVSRPAVYFSSSSSSSYVPMKCMFNSQVAIPISNKFDLVPGVLYSSVPGSNELILGGSGGYSPEDIFIPVKRLYATTMFRSNLFTDFDAMILGGGLAFPTFDLGITYDINISPLRHASNYHGAFEISIVYNGRDLNKPDKNAPCFIY